MPTDAGNSTPAKADGFTVACVGMTTIDTLLSVRTLPCLPDDLRVLTNRAHVCLGGKGMVTAYVLHNLGCNVRLLSLVGSQEPTPDSLLGQLPIGFDRTFLLPWHDTTSRTWVLISQTHEIVTAVQVSTIQEQKSKEDDIRGLSLKCVDGTDVIYITCEYIPLVRGVLEVATEAAVPIVVNLSSALLGSIQSDDRDILLDLVGSAHTILLNEGESRVALAMLAEGSWEDIDGPEAIIITSGKEGGRIFERDHMKWSTFSSQESKVSGSTLGAGDTFNAAFIKSRFLGKNGVLESCGAGVKAAALSLTYVGALPICGDVL